MAKGYFIFRDDETTCGGRVIEGFNDNRHFNRPQSCEMHKVTCGKNPGVYMIVGGLPRDRIHGRKMAGTLHSFSSCPCRATFLVRDKRTSYEFIPERSEEEKTQDAAEAKAWSEQQKRLLNSEPPVFAKSCLREAGCTDAGTEDEPQGNVGGMAFYMAVPPREEAPKRVPLPPQNVAYATPPKKSLFDKVSGFFFGEAQAATIAGSTAERYHGAMPVRGDALYPELIPVNPLTGGSQGMPGAGAGMAIAAASAAIAIGVMSKSGLKGWNGDLLSAEKLLEVAEAGGTVPTRVRYNWVADPDTGRQKAVGYHTSADSGRDQVRVRLLSQDSMDRTTYRFYEAGQSIPTLTWTPDAAPGSSSGRGWHTGNDTQPVGTVSVPGLEYPDIQGVTITTTPLPEEKDFRDYILVFPGNVHPPIYVYLSKPPVEFLEVELYSDFKRRSRQGKYEADHMPSAAAVKAYLKANYPEMSPEDIELASQDVAAIVIPKEVHKKVSETYGGRNSSAQIAMDSKDLRAALDRNLDAIKAALKEHGATEEQIEAARAKMHKLNSEMGLY